MLKYFSGLFLAFIGAVFFAAPGQANPASHGAPGHMEPGHMPRGQMQQGHAMPRQHLSDRFDRMDANGDGKLVLEEFRAAFPNMNEQAFSVMDVNGNGSIERAEWFDFMEGHARGTMPGMARQPPRMNNIPGDPLIPPPDSSDLPLMRPPQ